jgi:hypothetical protein
LPGLIEVISDVTKAAESPLGRTLAREAFDLSVCEAKAIGSAISDGKVGNLANGLVAAADRIKSALTIPLESGPVVPLRDFDWLSRAKVTPNPYVTEFQAAVTNPNYRNALDIARYRKPASEREYIQAYRFQSTVRHSLTHKYSWSLPNEEALATVAEQGKVLEAGAGSGYWASLVKAMGGDIVAFDRHGTNVQANRFHSTATTAWTDILTGKEERVKDFPDRTLFMSWPPDGEPFAYNVLNHYRGNRMLFVGEGRGGITGDYAFHDLLDSDWKQIKTVKLQNWECAEGFIDDSMSVFERK